MTANEQEARDLHGRSPKGGWMVMGPPYRTGPNGRDMMYKDLEPRLPGTLKGFGARRDNYFCTLSCGYNFGLWHAENGAKLQSADKKGGKR